MRICSWTSTGSERRDSSGSNRSTSTGSDAVTYRSADRIATITIDRAERMNRIDADVVEGLHAAWHRFMGDDEARVAILPKKLTDYYWGSAPPGSSVSPLPQAERGEQGPCFLNTNCPIAPPPVFPNPVRCLSALS